MYLLNGKLVYEFDDAEKNLKVALERVIRARDLLVSKTDFEDFLERPIGDDAWDRPVVVARLNDEEILQMMEDLLSAADSLALLEMNLYEHHLIPRHDNGRFKGGFPIDPSAIKAQRRRQAKPRRAAAAH